MELIGLKANEQKGVACYSLKQVAGLGLQRRDMRDNSRGLGFVFYMVQLPAWSALACLTGCSWVTSARLAR